MKIKTTITLPDDLIEDVASLVGWTPTITKPSEDEGALTVEMENPVSLEEAVSEFAKKTAQAPFLPIFEAKAEATVAEAKAQVEEAKSQAQAQLDQVKEGMVSVEVLEE